MKETFCSTCHRPVRGNINTERIITCPQCVQRLLAMSQEDKVRLMDRFLGLRDFEAARSVESFINGGVGSRVAIRLRTPSANAFKVSSNRLQTILETCSVP